MRRVVLALLGTVTGLVLLLGFKAHPDATVSAPAAAVSVPSPQRPTTGPGTSPAPPSTSRPSSAAPTTRTVTGGTADTPYGPVQIQVTLTAGKITKIRSLQLPNDRQRSVEIARYAVPRLVQETLAAQSAQIHMISGATYTSEGYRTSLQSALDEAGVK